MNAQPQNRGRGSNPASRANLMLGHKSPKHALPRGSYDAQRVDAVRRANTANPKVIAATRQAGAQTHAAHPELFGRAQSTHINAKAWFLKSPDGRPWQFENLVAFVLEHPELFPPGYAELRDPRRSNSIKAVGGLNNIRPGGNAKGRRAQSWFGWVWDHAAAAAASATE